MKVRSGFVSNSSSSSFIVMLPKGLDFPALLDDTPDAIEETLDWVGEDMEENEIKEGIINAFNRLCDKGEVWDEDSGMFSEGLRKALESFIIAGVDHGPDAGKLILVRPEEREKIVNILSME